MHPGGSAEPTPFPERVGRYELLLPIASGGMGTVYLARTTGLGGFEKEVALKLTHSHLRDESGFATALVDEANLAGRIRHPNVVSVLDVGEDPHGVFLVMEYVEGETLAGLARLADEAHERIPESVTLRIVVDVLAGLHAAHELRDAGGELMGLVHRDVTPHNVLVGVDGVSKLTDFGVAKAATRLAMTGTGLIKGKVAYMAPEQALGQPLDRTCDIWAIGVVLWELVAGTRLHPTTNDAATLLRIVSQPPPRLRLVRPDVAPRLDDIVARALDPDRTRRFSTAEELGRALEAAAVATVGRADQKQVGQYVRQAVANRLARRRDKIAEVLALRGRLSRITRAALPSSLETPSAQDALTRVDEPPTLLDHVSGPGGPRSGPGGTVLLPSDPRASGPLSTAEVTGSHTRTETISVSTARPSLAPARRRRVGIVLGVAGTFAAVGIAAVAVRDRPAEQASSSTHAGTASSSAAPRAITPDDLPLARGDEERSVVLTAAAPITGVRVGDREVEFTRAQREQRLTVTSGEAGQLLVVTVADGRTGSIRLDASERLEIPLPPVAHGAAPARRSPAAAPAPGAAPRDRGGLLGNPYGSTP